MGGEHDWTGWDGTVYNNKDIIITFMMLTGTILVMRIIERYITADSDGNVLDTPILDETGTHLGFSHRS